MTAHVNICPACKRASAHRSKARWFGERLFKLSTSRRIYRCDSCGWRGWVLPMEQGAAFALESPADVDLKKIDQIETRRSVKPR